MYYSVPTYTLFSEPVDQAIETLMDDGWRNIEIMGEGEHHGRMLFHLDSERLKNIARSAEKRGVSFGYHLPINGFNPAATDQHTETLWNQCLKVIETLNVKYILLHPGSAPSLARGIASIVDFTKKMLSDLPEDVLIVIENVPKSNNAIGSSMEHLLEIIDQVKDNRLKIMLDTGHCYMNEKDDFLTECKKTFPSLFGLHVNDNHGEEDEHLQVGEGTIPFHDLMSFLPDSPLTLVMETNTLDRAKHSKHKLQQLVKRNTGDRG